MHLPEYIDYEDGLEYIGPLEGWAREKEYCPVWVPVQWPPCPRQKSPGKETAKRCAVGMPVYLFWEEDNPRDLTAVAVYYHDPRRDSFSAENRIGHLPEGIAKSCVDDFAFRNRRIGALVRRLFISDSGNVEIYLELIAFLNPDQRKGKARTSRDGRGRGNCMSAKDFPGMCS